MVPRDSLPQRQLTAGMHGLSLVNRDDRTTSASLPASCLPVRYSSMLRSPSASPSRSGPTSRSGLLLARNENSSPSPHSEVVAPGLPLRHPPDCRRIRSSPMIRTALPASAPLQGFLCPSRSVRSADLALRKPTFTSRPISLRSPLPDSINDDGHGSMFQVRYVSRGPLFL
jgi:hypothetical protein